MLTTNAAIVAISLNLEDRYQMPSSIINIEWCLWGSHLGAVTKGWAVGSRGLQAVLGKLTGTKLLRELWPFSSQEEIRRLTWRSESLPAAGSGVRCSEVLLGRTCRSCQAGADQHCQQYQDLRHLHIYNSNINEVQTKILRWLPVYHHPTYIVKCQLV